MRIKTLQMLGKQLLLLEISHVRSQCNSPNEDRGAEPSRLPPEKGEAKGAGTSVSLAGHRACV